MTRIAVSRTMGVEHSKVWDALADLGSHPVWMKEAKSIAFVGDQRRGAGTRMEVKTVLGPICTVDVMEVVGWHEGTSIEVAHKGIVWGRGTLGARAQGSGTVVSWVEELTFPWWLGGRSTGWLARPILTAIWQGNLRRLEESLRSP